MPDETSWLHDNGGTNVDAWIAAFKKDNDVFWYTDIGHLLNIIEELVERS